jgi:hypothetical protein
MHAGLSAPRESRLFIVILGPLRIALCFGSVRESLSVPGLTETGYSQDHMAISVAPDSSGVPTLTASAAYVR